MGLAKKQVYFGYAVVVILQAALIITLVVSFQKMRAELKKTAAEIRTDQTNQEEQERQWEAAREEREAIATRVEGLEGVVEELGEELRGESRRMGAAEDRILAMVVEKLVYDYTQRGLEYFRGREYGKAQETFGRAIRYQRNNTTLLFYQSYSLYLSRVEGGLSSAEWEQLGESVRDLGRRGFREVERVEYTVEEMEQKVREMRYNIEERRSSGGSL